MVVIAPPAVHQAAHIGPGLHAPGWDCTLVEVTEGEAYHHCDVRLRKFTRSTQGVAVEDGRATHLPGQRKPPDAGAGPGALDASAAGEQDGDPTAVKAELERILQSPEFDAT